MLFINRPASLNGALKISVTLTVTPQSRGPSYAPRRPLPTCRPRPSPRGAANQAVGTSRKPSGCSHCKAARARIRPQQPPWRPVTGRLPSTGGRRERDRGRMPASARRQASAIAPADDSPFAPGCATALATALATQRAYVRAVRARVRRSREACADSGYLRSLIALRSRSRTASIRSSSSSTLSCSAWR
jgi:hypothetical protein